MKSPKDDQPSDDGELQFRSRHSYLVHRERVIEDLLKELHAHYETTDPTKGEATSAGKDAAAFSTLVLAGKLVDEVAGWAIDHAMGKAAVGQGWVGSQPSEVRKRPEFLTLVEEADKHEHEMVGSRLHDDLNSNDLDPLFVRQALQNFLRPNAGALPWKLVFTTDKALTALSFGEVLPVFQPSTDIKRKVRYREYLGQLRAMEHVEYRVTLGQKKKIALEEVGSAYGVDWETIRTWERRTREELGNLKVSARLANARAQARRSGMDRSFVILAEKKFGADALTRDGEHHTKIKREAQEPAGS